MAEWSWHPAGNLRVQGSNPSGSKVQTPAAPGNLWPQVAKKRTSDSQSKTVWDLLKIVSIVREVIMYFAQNIGLLASPSSEEVVSCYPSIAKWGKSLEILFRDLFKNAWRHLSVCHLIFLPHLWSKNPENWHAYFPHGWLKSYCPVFWYFA